MESDDKGHDNRHNRQDKLSRRTSIFLGVRKRDTVRGETDPREPAATFEVQRPRQQRGTSAVCVPALSLMRNCIALNARSVRKTLVVASKKQHTLAEDLLRGSLYTHIRTWVNVLQRRPRLSLLL